MEGGGGREGRSGQSHLAGRSGGEEVRAALKEGAEKFFKGAVKERRKAWKVSGAGRVEGAER